MAALLIVLRPIAQADFIPRRTGAPFAARMLPR
jgi:hypothetical protein